MAAAIAPVPERDSFVTEFPRSAITASRDAYLAVIAGQSINKKQVGLAVENTFSYVWGEYVVGGDPEPMFATASRDLAAGGVDVEVASHDEIMAAYDALLAEDDGSEAAPRALFDRKEMLKKILNMLITVVLPMLI